MKIDEEVPITTTNNGGAGLDDPKLPINKQDVFRRVKSLSDKHKQKRKLLSKDNKD